MIDIGKTVCGSGNGIASIGTVNGNSIGGNLDESTGSVFAPGSVLDCVPVHVPGSVPGSGSIPVETSGRTSLPDKRDARDKCDAHDARDKSDNRDVRDKPDVSTKRIKQPQYTRTPRLRPKSVSSFMAGVKSVISKQINEIRNTPGARVLQYRFHDHIIRDEHELFRIRQYIKNNPVNWNQDTWNHNAGYACVP